MRRPTAATAATFPLGGGALRSGLPRTTPHGVPGTGRGMRRLAAAAMLALPLAAALATVPPDLPLGDPAPALLEPRTTPLPPDAARPHRQLRADEGRFDCPPEPRRTEEAHLGQVILTVRGCLAAAEPLLATNLPGDARVRFSVAPGARHLLVMFQPDGSEAVNGTLAGPWPFRHLRGHDAGDAGGDRNSLLRFEVHGPAEGGWELRAWLEQLAVARRWTATVVATS